jgi:HD-GYP domain-containing protein (c-di-GMP phosphodiesterase class II)
MKTHPLHSYDMLSEFPEAVRHGARAHHEKFGGNGYPDNLAGSDISLMAQITAVSDIYDAMVSQRAYKPPRNPFNIIAWIQKLSGTELSQTIVNTFINNMPKEMLQKTVLLSNGDVGIVHQLDYDDLEYPYIRIGSKVFKSNKDVYCMQILLEETFQFGQSFLE